MDSRLPKVAQLKREMSRSMARRSAIRPWLPPRRKMTRAICARSCPLRDTRAASCAPLRLDPMELIVGSDESELAVPGRECDVPGRASCWANGMGLASAQASRVRVTSGVTGCYYVLVNFLLGVLCPDVVAG